MAQFDALTERYRGEQRRLDFRAAQICALIAEVNRDRKKRSKPFTPADFMPKEESRDMSSPKVKQALKRINKILGGEEK